MMIESLDPVMCRCRTCKAVLFSFASAMHYLETELIRRNEDIIELGLSTPGPQCTECGKPFLVTRPWASYPRQEDYGVLVAAPPVGRSPRIATAALGFCEPCDRFLIEDKVIRELQLFKRGPAPKEGPGIEYEEIPAADMLSSFFRMWIPPRVEGIQETPGLPVASIGIVGVCILMNYAVTMKGPGILLKWAFYPLHPFLNSGLNWVSSLFLHANRNHLLGNLFVFFPISWSLEGHLGLNRFVMMFLFSGFLGHMGHLLWADPSVPSIGASGAIAGAMTYLMMQFPRARLVKTLDNGFSTSNRSLLGSFMEVRIPVPIWVGSWCLLQVNGLILHPESHVNYAAHVGGAFGGILFWALFRPRDVKSE